MKMGASRFHELIPDVQANCNDLTMMKVTRIAAPVMVNRQHALFHLPQIGQKFQLTTGVIWGLVSSKLHD